MVKWLGISALAVAAFVVFMAAGSGRAAEPAPVAKAADTKAAATKAAAPTAAKDSAPATKESGAKPAATADATGKSDNKTDKAAKDTKDAKASAGEAKDAGKTTSAEASGQHRAKAKRKRDGAASDDAPELPPGQGPPPPSPLSVNDLHQETNRERGPGGDFNAPPRVKLEQLLSEVSKARQSLHDDTVKLEALSGNEPSHGAEPAADAAPPVAGAAGQPAQKNPLDVLAKALRGIKPEQAGPIVARLDKGLAATVLLKMPPADAGKIMGALKPEVAAELATQIAMRAPSSQPGGKR